MSHNVRKRTVRHVRPSEDSDQTAQSDLNLYWAHFGQAIMQSVFVFLFVFFCLFFFHTDNEEPDQPARMRRLG